MMKNQKLAEEDIDKVKSNYGGKVAIVYLLDHRSIALKEEIFTEKIPIFRQRYDDNPHLYYEFEFMDTLSHLQNLIKNEQALFLIHNFLLDSSFRMPRRHQSIQP